MTVALVTEQEPVFTYPCGAYTVMRVKADEPFTRRMIPHVVERAIDFIDKMRCDTDPVWLGQLLYSGFYTNSNLLHVLVAIDPKERIIAHSISYIESIQGIGPTCCILQVEKNEGGPDIIDLGMKLTLEWSKSLGGVKAVRNYSSTRSRAKLFAKYGLSEYRIISQMNLD